MLFVPASTAWTGRSSDRMTIALLSIACTVHSRTLTLQSVAYQRDVCRLDYTLIHSLFT